MSRQRLNALWLSYRSKVIPQDASSVQVIECRRAFYAGAESLLRCVMSALEPGIDETDNDLRMMQEIEDEIKSFAQQVKDGIA